MCPKVRGVSHLNDDDDDDDTGDDLGGSLP